MEVEHRLEGTAYNWTEMVNSLYSNVMKKNQGFGDQNC